MSTSLGIINRIAIAGCRCINNTQRRKIIRIPSHCCRGPTMPENVALATPSHSLRLSACFCISFNCNKMHAWLCARHVKHQTIGLFCPSTLYRYNRYWLFQNTHAAHTKIKRKINNFTFKKMQKTMQFRIFRAQKKQNQMYIHLLHTMNESKKNKTSALAK